jgi:spermidine synthase
LQFIRKYQINEVLVINGIFMANNPYFPNKIKSMIHTPQAAHSAKKKSTSDSTAKIKTP